MLVLTIKQYNHKLLYYYLLGGGTCYTCLALKYNVSYIRTDYFTYVKIKLIEEEATLF